MSKRGKITEFFDTPAFRKQLKEVKDGLKDFIDTSNKAKPIRVQLQGAEKTKEVVKGVTELSLAVKEYSRIQNGVATAQAKLNALESEHAKKLAEVKLAQQDANRAIKEEIQLNQAAEGSIKQKQVQLKQLQRTYDELSAAQRNSSEGKALLKSIQDLDKELKTLEGSTGRFQRNVGNYSSATKILEKALNDVRSKLDDYNKSGKVSAEILSQLIKEEGLLAQLVETQVTGFASATQEVRNNEKALQQLAAAGQQNTQFYKDLLQETANLRDNVSDLKTEIKNLGSDTRTLDGLIGTAQALAGVYGIAQGAAALFGDENEELQKTFVKLQAVMTVLNGLQAIQAAVQKESSASLFLNNVATKISIGLQRAYAFAVGASTGAMKAFRIALAASGIGLLLLLLPKVANAMGLFGSSTKDAAEDQKNLAESVKEATEALIQQADELKRVRDQSLQPLRDEIELLEASGKNADLVFAKRRQLYDLQKQNAESTLKDLKLTDSQISSLNSQVLQLQDQQLQASTRAAQLNKKILTEQNEGAKERLKAQKTIAEVGAQAAQDELNRIKPVRDAALNAIADKNSAEQNLLKLQIERSNRFRDLTREDQKIYFEITKGNIEDQIKDQIQIAEAEQLSLTTRIEARQKAQELEARIIEAQKEFELGQANLSVAQIKKINEDANDSIRASEKKLASDLISIYQNVRQAQKDALTADIELGSDIKSNPTVIEERIQREEDAFARRQANLEYDRDITIKNLTEERNLKLKAADSERERTEIEEFYQNKRREKELETDRFILLAAVDLAQAKLKLITDPTQRAAMEAQIASLKKQLEELSGVKIDLDTEKAERKLDKLQSEIQAIGGRIMDAFSAIGDMISANTDRQKNAIQEQIDQIEIRKDRELEAIEKSGASEQEKAARVQLLNARTQSQREQLERRQRQLDQERAKFEKARNIAKIILDTASGVVEALPNIPLSILVGLIGAVQLAAAIATPIPKFKHGKNVNDDYEGLAVVGDGGKHELHIKENGQAEITPNKSTLTWVGKNDIIYPDADKVIRAMLISSFRRNERMSERVADASYLRLEKRVERLDKTMQEVKRVIENKPVPMFKNSFRGFEGGYRRGHDWHQYIKDQT